MKILSTVAATLISLLLAQTSSTMRPKDPASLRPDTAMTIRSQHLDTTSECLLAELSPGLASVAQPRQLSLADRIFYQHAIEEVYWRHRIWPQESPNAKPSLDEVMREAELQKKVEDYLRNSEALEDYWQQPVIAEQLQREIDRMAQHTRQPEVLRELFEALGNDPFVIAECLARPALSERLLTNLYAHDERFHGELKRRAEADLQGHSSVEQMKRSSGGYSEIEWVRSDSGNLASTDTRDVGVVKMTDREWKENIQKLAAGFGYAKIDKGRPSSATMFNDVLAAIPAHVLSTLQEDEGYYYARALLQKTQDCVKLATVAWRKEPLQSWRARAETQGPRLITATGAYYTLPLISSEASGCTNDSWTPTDSAPQPRDSHTAVWTGSEMIIWGGYAGILLNDGGRYNPSIDTWTATSTTHAPIGRELHTAVWTGTEMIVWGGKSATGSEYRTGGRYNPATDKWTLTSITNAPVARESHTAVWTGSEMIVWGGQHFSNFTYVNLQTGGRYNPGTNSWTATSTINAPAPRYHHTAVWSGSEMIVWGGSYGLNTGGRYNPSSNSWTAVSTVNAPTGREGHTAVWAGSRMIVWGGFDGGGNTSNTGGRYNPATDKWAATSITNAPAGRSGHTAVWAGNQMIIWGGTTPPSNYFDSGGRYNPGTNTWTATSSNNTPTARNGHTAIWTGTYMIIWGGDNLNEGLLSSGGKYDLKTDSWTPTSTPSGRSGHTAVWTGAEMIIWGGGVNSAFFNTGGRYTPSTDSWTATSVTNAPAGRSSHTAVWTGSEMIVWGGIYFEGSNFIFLNTGGRYNPSTDSWTATTIINAPTARDSHAAVWTGKEMIVWGGYNSNDLNTGGRYNPATDLWRATRTANAPSARSGPTAVWTGTEMIVWGGVYYDGSRYFYLNTGGRYNPGTNIWTASSTVNAPIGREAHTAIWSGSEMIVWGGIDAFLNYSNAGGRYSPSTNSWTATSTTNAPTGRYIHTAIWTGSEMIVWGGTDDSINFNNGGRYNPTTNAWVATTTANAATGRFGHTAVWTGDQMIVWGGSYGLNTGGKYCAPPP